MEKRPFWWSVIPSNFTAGLIIIIVFMALNASLNVLALFGALGGQDIATAATALVGAAFYGLAAYGVYKLRRWGRLFTIVISILMVVFGFATMVAINLTNGVYMIVTHGLMAIYLLSEKGRKLFYPEVKPEIEEG